MRKLACTLILACLSTTCGALAQTSYFPHGVFSETRRCDSEAAKRNSDLLQLAHEIFLFKLKAETGSMTFRLLWLPSFDDIWIVRLDALPDQSARLTTKVIGGRGSQHPGQLIRADQRDLNQSEMSSFFAMPAVQAFWSLYPRGREFGCDGADWVLEGVRPSSYHVVSQWSPTGGPVREIGQRLALVLAGLHSHFPDQAIY